MYVLFYGVSSDTALILADRWINEDSQQKMDYQVHGIDADFSVFD
jgi:hypothetical protein